MQKLVPLVAFAMGRREFRFVPFGQKAPATSRPMISCDGKVAGEVDLELSHWNGNETPDEFYADTSTEIALRFAETSPPEFDNALVMNNHYDTDGVLSSWACIADPQLVLQYKDLMREGAEAGDFGEWSSDNGVKLDCSIEALSTNNDQEGDYQRAFEHLPLLLEDLTKNNGDGYKHLWKSGFQEALDSWKEIEEGRAKLKRGPGRIAILQESPGRGRLSAYALHRGLKEAGLWDGTTRILRVSGEGSTKNYSYEKIGHGWVQKLVKRFNVPSVDNLPKFVAELNANMDGANWKSGGSSLVGICHWTRTKSNADLDPFEIAEVLHSLDAGAQALQA